MESGLISAVSGALAQSRRIEITANNLANADTVGFKADGAIFEEYVQGANKQDTRQGMSNEIPNKIEHLNNSQKDKRVVLYGDEYINLKQGSTVPTNNPLDIAIQGNGFLEVQSPDGIRLTRAGNLSLDRQGRLVNRDGFLVLGQGNANGPAEQRAINIGNSKPVIDRDGAIYSRQGEAMQQVGQLSIVQVGNPRALKKVGGSLFEAGEAADLRSAGQGAAVGRDPAAAPNAKENPLGSLQVPAVVHQGALESSNVNPIREMTQMIEAHRIFEQNAKLMQSFGSMNEQSSALGRF